MLLIVILLGIAVALLAVLVVGLLRSHAEILRRLHELGAGLYDDELPHAGHEHAGVTSTVELSDRRAPDNGTAPDIRTVPGVPTPRTTDTPAHDISGLTPAGRAAAVGIVGAEHTTLLAFLSSGCGTCANFWQAFNEGEGRMLPGSDTRLVIVTKGPDDESQSSVAGLSPAEVTTIMSTQAYDEYAVPLNPYFILVDGPSGKIVGEGAASTWEQVAHLLDQAVADAGMATLRRLPASAPSRMGGPAREARSDAELFAAGIGPGHPSLFPDRLPVGDDE